MEGRKREMDGRKGVEERWKMYRRNEEEERRKVKEGAMDGGTGRKENGMDEHERIQEARGEERWMGVKEGVKEIEMKMDRRT